MRKLTLLITLIGIITLISLLIFQKPIEISSKEQLSSLTPNQLVKVEGKVIKQSQNNNLIQLVLNTNLSLTYSGKYHNFLNKKVQVEGTYDSFLYDKIKVLKINIINDN